MEPDRVVEESRAGARCVFVVSLAQYDDREGKSSQETSTTSPDYKHLCQCVLITHICNPSSSFALLKYTTSPALSLHCSDRWKLKISEECHPSSLGSRQGVGGDITERVEASGPGPPLRQDSGVVL